MTDRSIILPDPFIRAIRDDREPGRFRSKPTIDSTKPQQRIRAFVEKSATQAITTGAGFTTVTFGTVLFNEAGIWTASKFTIPSTGRISGMWALMGLVTWDGNATGVRRELRIFKNGTTALRTVIMSPVANDQSQDITYMVNDPNAGDFYELQVSHDRGSDLNLETQCHFGIIHMW